ncbi:hypothetical protein, partial [Rhizobium sp. 18055]|uniref:hypothetical protein n=1 Tax=Rhizobium sp. 18055 TaxID=2681403 RepID=UPI001AEDFD66
MAAIGVRVVNGVNSVDTGHMYVVLIDDDGNKVSYGFYPDNKNLGSVGAGRVSNADIDMYENNPS